MTAPNSTGQRLNRLLYMLAINKEQVWQYLDDIQKETIKGVATTMITRYPESKEMRGLMKLVNKKKDDKCGYKLQYRTDIKERNHKETLEEWLKKEEQWKKARNKSQN